VSELLTRLLASRWGRWAGIGLVGLLVVGLAWGAWALWSARYESQGGTAMAQARIMVAQAQAPTATAESKERAQRALEEVIAEYPRLSSAALAAYQLGNIRFAAAQYPQARAAYNVAKAKARSATLGALASLGTGYTFEAEKNYEAAEKAYRDTLGGARPQDFLYEEAMSDVARVQELGGKRTAAVETYQRILKDLPDARRADEIRARLASLQSEAKP